MTSRLDTDARLIAFEKAEVEIMRVLLTRG
jgi:hypothetical protein